MTYIQELQQKIKNLEDGFDIKSVEMHLLQSEIQDTLKPNKLLSDLNGYVLEMMNDLIEYEKKTKLTPRMQASKKRLIKMLFLSSDLSQLGSMLQSLKCINREIVGKIQLLRVENTDLRNQLKICNQTSRDL